MRCPHCKQLIVSKDAALTLEYMRREAPKRGGYMFEGARPDYEAGKYQDHELAELLSAGLIKPHHDPSKGWVVIE